MRLYPDLPLYAANSFRNLNFKQLPSKILFGPDVAEAMVKWIEKEGDETPVPHSKTEFMGVRFGYMLAPGVAVVK